MDLSSARTFSSGSAPTAGAKVEGLQGTAPLAVPCHTGEPPLTHPAAPLRADGSKKDEAGLVPGMVPTISATVQSP